MHHPAPASIRPLKFIIFECVLCQYLSQIHSTLIVILGSSVDRVSALEFEGPRSIPDEGDFFLFNR